MVRHNLEYPKDVHNTVNRYKHQAVYSLTTIHSIINTSPVLHVSFMPSPDDPFPVILPLIGQMGSFDRPSASLGDPLECYLHGYVSSRIMNVSRGAAATGGAAEGGSRPNGLPVCITATHVDGLVLTLTPNSHNYNYRSAVLFGHAVPVTSPEERLWAMELITDSVVAGRWPETRVPPNAGELASTAILRVTIESGSAKVREGEPTDEPVDLNDPAVTSRVWTGVLPVYQAIADPVAGSYNALSQVPDHITGYIERTNAQNKKYALEAAVKSPPVKKPERGEDE